MIAKAEADGPQYQGRQQQEHRQIQTGKRCGIQQRPSSERSASAQDEPYLIALPDRLEGLEKNAALGVGSPQESKRGAEAEIKTICDRKADQQHTEKQPPGHS